MEEPNKDIQQYADEHCGGDRFRAVYDIMSSGVECALDPYVDSMSQEDATFAVILLQDDAIRIYGGEKSYKNVVKHYSLLSSLGLEEEALQKPNPFVKPLLKQLVLLVCAIVVPALLTIVLPDSSWLPVLQSILLGLFAMSTANALLPVLRFQKVKRFFKHLPDPDPATESQAISYEDALAMYEALSTPKSTPEEAEEALRRSKKANISALVYYPLFVLLTLTAIILSNLHVVAGCVGCALVAAFFMWKMSSAFKAVLSTRDAVAGLNCQFPAMANRQSGCTLGMIGLGALYLLTGGIGIALCITFMVR